MIKHIILAILRGTQHRGRYLFLINTISQLLRTGVTARTAENDLITVNLYFVPHFKRLTFYIYGLDARAKNIAKDYMLDQGPFKDGDVVVDCGANSGDLRLALQRRGVESLHYIGFEPSGSEFDCLTRNTAAMDKIASDNRRIALNKEAGEVKFYQSTASADGSLLEPEHYDSVVTVNADTLDNQVADVPWIQFIKLEAEGLEPEILEGSTETLARTSFLAADVGFERGIREESTLPAVVNFMHRHGFEVIGNSRQRLTVLFRNTALTDE